MPLPTYQPTQADFDRVQWKTVIVDCTKKECEAYSGKFLRLATEAGAVGDEPAEAVHALLGYITHLRFVRDSGSATFAPAFGPTPNDDSALAVLTDGHLAVLAQILPSVTDSELKARFSDVLWLRRRDPNYARMAVANYLESAVALEDPEHWISAVERLRRAADIARGLGRDKEGFSIVMGAIEKVLDRHSGNDPLYLSVSCIEMLLEHGHGEPAKYSKLCQRLAEGSSLVDTDRAERCWTLKAECDRRDGKAAEARDALCRAAEAHVKRAELHAGGGSVGYALATECVRRAIRILTKVENTNGRRAELHTLMLKYQRGSVSELKPVYGGEIDITAAVAAARASVQGRPFAEAVRILAMGIFSPSSYASVHAQAEKDRQQYPFQFLIPTHYLDSEGRTAAIGGRRREKTDDPSEAVLLDYMYRTPCMMEYALHAQAYIEPVRGQMLTDSCVGMRDWLAITMLSPFVPPGREELWARALHAGYIGDFASMLHLVVPQIEHALRWFLRQAGEVTSSLRDDGIQEEFQLARLLSHPELMEILGQDYIFHLKCLLVERAGANLRNLMAHGLIADRETSALSIRYLWWLALRLCLHPLVNVEQSRVGQRAESSDDDNPADGAR